MPSEKHLAVLRTLASIETGTKGSGFINEHAAEECCDKGWVEPVGRGHYVLTDAGRAILKAEEAP